MATQYTSILKLALPTQGELSGSWGDVVNDNITSMVEEAVAGLKTINTWTADAHTLTTADGTTSESRAAMLVLTDTGTALTGAGELICPAASKLFVVKNDTGQTITVKTSGGTGVAVPDGSTMWVFCDGTNVEEATTYVTSLSVGSITIDGNSLEPIIYTNTATSKTLVVNEKCLVTASGQTITLPATPSEDDRVGVIVENFTDTVVARNGSTIMELAEDMTLNRA
jgi:hypothetical protein